MLQDITLLMTNCHLRKITVGGALAPTTLNPKQKPAAALTSRNGTRSWRTCGKAVGGPLEADGNRSK